MAHLTSIDRVEVEELVDDHDNTAATVSMYVRIQFGMLKYVLQKTIHYNGLYYH